MQNGRNDRGSYNYTAGSAHSNQPSGNNRGTAPAGSNQPQPKQPQMPRGSASGQNQPRRAVNTTQSGVPRQSSVQNGYNQPVSNRPRPADNRPQTANTGARAQNNRTQTANAHSRPNNSATARKTQPERNPGQANARHGGSQAVVRRDEQSVAAPRKRGGLINYWKGVFRLTPGEIERSAVVPREVGGFDYVFLIIVLVLLAFGTVMVYSASYAYSMQKYGDSYYIITRQTIFVFIGLALMIAAMFFKPETYRKWTPVIYAVCFFMLCVVPIPGIGVLKKGARRWIHIGVDFQPSEMMKFALAAMLAWYFDKYRERILEYKNFWRASFFGVFLPYTIVGVTCFLIILEKHLSGTVIMFLIGTLIIFAGGALKRWIIGLFAAGGTLLFLISVFTNYTKRRLDIWLHPEDNPLDGGWQTLQGLNAIGSGGFFGVGIGESRQKHMYVSEPQNDFIFTIVCEELGFIGAVAVISLFMLFIYRGIVIAMRAPDTYSTLLVIGIVGKVAIQAILNVAVVTNSIPNTGISLPFFSYGGTSLCILLAEMGVVLSISRYSKQRK